MIALDTNVLVRFLVEDDLAMSAAATALLEAAEQADEPLFVSLIVSLELNWVLTACYHFSRDEVLTVFDELLSMPALTFEASDCLGNMVALGRTTNLDLADILIGLRAKAEGCESTATFDKRAGQSALFRTVR